MTKLALETGGKVYFPTSTNEISSIATEILGELRIQYLISYMPTNESRDGAYRKIRVEVSNDTNNGIRRAITRTGRTISNR